MKLFCLKCNKSTDYSSSKPSFCSHCGKPYIDSTMASTAPVIQNPVQVPIQSKIVPRGRLNRQIEDDNTEYPEDSQTVPQIDNIECEITVFNLRPNRESGKDVFNGGSLDEAKEVLGKKTGKTPKVNKIKQKQSKEEFVQQFKNQLSKKSRNERQSTEITG